MPNKKILVIGPILPQWDEIKYVAASLHFLYSDYDLEFIDPLQDLDNDENTSEYLQAWKERLNNLVDGYQVFIGFSLGGVILQYSFDLLAGKNKKIVLFSTPTFADDNLRERLCKVMDLARNHSLHEAINLKNQFVFYPQEGVPHAELASEEQARERLVKGLEYVLSADSREYLKNTNIPYLHLIGERSQLVNRDNVMVSLTAKLAVVPGAGMRVLQNNPSYCVEHINQFLQGIN